jgi:hypothetical protein
MTEARHACPREFRTALDVEAALLREAEIALLHNYDEKTIRSLHPLTQQTYWKLRELVE